MSNTTDPNLRKRELLLFDDNTGRISVLKTPRYKVKSKLNFNQERWK